jgi:Na+/melibiose symporter-like transporter
MLTIAPVEDAKLELWYIPIFPVTAPLFAVTIMKQHTISFAGVNIYFWVIGIGAIISVAIYLLQKMKKFWFAWFYVVLSLATSIMWLFVAASVVVDMISFSSVILGINNVLLGATFLAVGNTLADFFSNSSLAAMGFGVMALTGSIAG